MLVMQEPGASRQRIQELTNLPDHQLRVLLQAVAAIGVFERKGDGYFVPPYVAELFDDEHGDWRDILIGWRDVYYPAFADLTEAISSGRNVGLRRFASEGATLYQRLEAFPEIESRFHRAMAAFTKRSLPDLLAWDGWSSCSMLLDVGGGDGVTSRAISKEHPRLRSTVFDLPSVAGIGRTIEATTPGRVDFVSGDFFTEDFPTGHDVVLFSHVLEIFDGSQIQSLLRKAWQSLPDGGKVVLFGYNVSDSEDSGLFGARLGLYFNVLVSGTGMAYPVADYEGWLRSAGFSEVSSLRNLSYEHGLTIGVKRGSLA